MSSTIFLFSDFGYRDAYVGTMKAVMRDISPDVDFIDLCHDVEPQNVLSGAFILGTAVPYLPKRGIVLGVVDPGVGTERRAIAVETEDFILVGPDNGLFALAYERSKPKKAYTLESPDFQLADVSKTFHGRDIFAPAAAHIAAGVQLEEFGESVDLDRLARLPEIGPLIKEKAIEVSVLHTDHFGNVITNLSRAALDRMGRTPRGVRIGKEEAPFAETFADVPEGEPVCYFNSSGFFEVGVRNGSASEQFEVRQRDMLHVLTD